MCFYCARLVGDPHKPDCVIVQKKVRIRFSVELDIDVPHHWTKEDVEFRYNESTWCVDNLIDFLLEFKADNPTWCLCGRGKADYLLSDPTPKRQTRAEARAEYERHEAYKREWFEKNL